MENSINIIDRIHSEFDSASERLIQISNDFKTSAANIVVVSNDEQLINEGQILKKLGFTNTTKTKQLDIFNKEEEKVKSRKNNLTLKSIHIDESVNEYSKLYPFHKFILYSQVINICEKYNLYIGKSDLYKGDIPTKNIKELNAFDYDKIITNNKLRCIPDRTEPLCSYKFRSGDSYENKNKFINLYICAPKTSFEITKDQTIVGKEIFNLERVGFEFGVNPKLPVQDPVILLPVLTKLKQFGFIVITKWGKEADDINLQIPLTN